MIRFSKFRQKKISITLVNCRNSDLNFTQERGIKSEIMEQVVQNDN